MLLERKLVRIGDEQLQRYLDLYANEESISMNERQIEAIDKLFEIGFVHGEYPCPIKAEEHFIPKEYKELRFS